jgi:iron(III) transport system permease protein
MLVLMIAIVMLVDRALRGKASLHRIGSGSAREIRLKALGRWQIPAQLLLGLVSLFALVMPIAVICLWLVRGITNAQLLTFDLSSLWHTLGVALVTALLAVIAAIPVAVLAVRFPSTLSALIERTSYLGYALPGIVVALALVFFGARYVPWMYQTQAMLIFAYLVLFLPQAVGTIRTTLLQINPHVEEAARSLGRDALSVVIHVTIPLVRAGLLTGGALVFLTTMKELPATLLLSPIGFSTLATKIWSASEEAFFAQAAPYALILILVSSISVAILLWQEKR